MSQFIALVAGASGMIGKLVVEQLLQDPEYTEVKIIVRSLQAISNPKLKQLVIDYNQIAEVELKADHVYCCLGTTIAKAGSKPAFELVDKTYPLMVAKEALQQGATVFSIVTAGGANASSSIFYNKVKGDVENELMALGYKHLGIFRPSMLLGNRKEKRPIERAGQIVMQALDFLIPKRYKAIQASKVALAMWTYAKNPSLGTTIVESDVMNK